MAKCDRCNGSGKVYEEGHFGSDYSGPCGCSGGSGCTTCGGSGYISGGQCSEIDCPDCSGTGVVE